MVHQVEAETSDLGMNGGAGRIPAGFCTLTCAVYKWAQLHETVLKAYPSGSSDDPTYREYYTQWQALPPGSAREAAMKQMFFELAVREPGLVGWYCAVKLEMAVALTRALLTEQLRSADAPGQDAAKYKLASDLTARLGVDVDVDEAPDLQFFGQVDDYYATFEWSEGGMIHAHMAFWIVGAPRIDKIDVPRSTKDTAFVEIDAAPPGAEVVAEAEAADRLAAFWDRAYTEFNVAKTVAHESFTQPSAASRDVGVRQRLGPAEEKKSDPPKASHMIPLLIVYSAVSSSPRKRVITVGASWSKYWRDARALLLTLWPPSFAGQALLALRPGAPGRDFTSWLRWRSGQTCTICTSRALWGHQAKTSGVRTSTTSILPMSVRPATNFSRGS
jgi:hypothetical protein